MKKLFCSIFLLMAITTNLLADDPYFVIPQEFSFPSTATVPFGSQTVGVTVHFEYYNVFGNEDLVKPIMVVAVDEDAVSPYDLCNVGWNGYTPSSYTVYLSKGYHEVTYSLLSINPNTLNCYDPVIWQSDTYSITVKFKVAAQNNFSGGTVVVDGVTRNSPYYRTSYSGDNISVGAVEQSDGTYDYIWNTSGTNDSRWDYKLEGGVFQSLSSSQTTSYSVSSGDKNTILQAGLRKVCDITFSNEFSGSQDGGQMKVNGGTVSAPTSAYNVVEQNAINVEATYQYDLNYIKYTFDHWENEAGGRITTFYPSLHKNYKAVYTGRPIFNEPYNRNLHFNTYDPRNPETNVVLYWNEHSHEAVTQYQIWRQTKYNGVLSDPVHLTTVNRGTTSWTDYS